MVMDGCSDGWIRLFASSIQPWRTLVRKLLQNARENGKVYNEKEAKEKKNSYFIQNQ